MAQSPSCAHLRAFSSLSLAYILSSYTPDDPRLMGDCLQAIMNRLVDDVFGVSGIFIPFCPLQFLNPCHGLSVVHAERSMPCPIRHL